LVRLVTGRVLAGDLAAGQLAHLACGLQAVRAGTAAARSAAGCQRTGGKERGGGPSSRQACTDLTVMRKISVSLGLMP
ncbi:MAG: hypothetical protein QOJ03_406, partial [Frankiaceae bacterium]|nr:hypothetical protein [Frankiaceae bacterium]